MFIPGLLHFIILGHEMAFIIKQNLERQRNL